MHIILYIYCCIRVLRLVNMYIQYAYYSLYVLLHQVAALGKPATCTCNMHIILYNIYYCIRVLRLVNLYIQYAYYSLYVLLHQGAALGKPVHTTCILFSISTVALGCWLGKPAQCTYNMHIILYIYCCIRLLRLVNQQPAHAICILFSLFIQTLTIVEFV